MKSGMRILLGASLIFGLSAASSPTTAAAQNPVKKVGTAISKGTKTTVHNVKHAGTKAKHAARSTGRVRERPGHDAYDVPKARRPRFSTGIFGSMNSQATAPTA